jgi:hypothetical protein
LTNEKVREAQGPDDEMMEDEVKNLKKWTKRAMKLNAVRMNRKKRTG